MNKIIENINAIIILTIILSIISLIIYLAEYLLRFIYNGLTNTTIHQWGLWALAALIIGFIILVLISSKPDKSLRKK